jgi:hypothetical protein
MCGEVVMVESLGCAVKLRWLEPIRHKRGLLGGCDAHTSNETSVDTVQASGNH